VRRTCSGWGRHGIGLVFALLVGLVSAAECTAADWHVSPAPLVTRWARDVTPEHARPEYPRPQMVRRAWMNLNGLWEFAFDDHGNGRKAGWQSGTRLAGHILAPFTYEAALSGIGKGSEVHERIWYRRAFTVPRTWRRGEFQGGHVLLHFDAVDWQATVWVNDYELGTHRGGYAPFTLDISRALRPSGPQEVVVAVYDPADPRRGAYQPKGKQLGSHGIFYTRTTGVWQTVWLEPAPRTYISGLDMTADPETGRLSVKAEVSRSAGMDVFHTRLRLSARASTLGGPWITATGPTPRAVPIDDPGPNDTMSAGWGSWAPRWSPSVSMTVAHPRPWSPETPILYDLNIELVDGSRVIDRVRSYTGFRKLGAANGRLTLNGQPYFYRGVLDQGYWPDGILTPPSDSAIRAEVEMIKALGFNCARKHVKVEDPRWYYWCDRLGLAVWQDMSSSHNLKTDEAKQNFRQELTEVLWSVRQHPCVVHWIPFNENWGDPGPFQDEMVRLIHGQDSSRLVTDASGWTQRDLTDVIDAHDYSNQLLKQGVEHPVKPKVVGEFGGIALPVPGHTWTQGWGYQSVRTPEDLLRRLRFQVSQLYTAPNLSGFIYTQLTDVEQEQNGLLTYDRLPKAPPERVAAVITGKDRLSPEELVQTGYLNDWWVLGPIPLTTRLSSASPNRENERVMGAALARAWVPNEASLEPRENGTVRIGRQALTWKHAPPVTDALDLIQALGPTENAVAYAVANFDAPQAMSGLKLLFASDDAAKVWLNGRPLWTINSTRGVNLDQDEAPNVSLRAGRNLLVVKVVQGVGGWGTAARFVHADGSPVMLSTRP
jgi:hypothetical protein